MFNQVIEDILDYLRSAENAELDPWICDDLRIAWLTVLYAAQNYPHPFVAAEYKVLGCHPDRLQELLTERRKALLGRLYNDFYPTTEAPPKKPPKSERLSGVLAVESSRRQSRS